jgi:hypothetical protein
VAQARDTLAQAHRTAFKDCLEFIPDSTIGSCMRLAAREAQQPAPAAAPQDGGSMEAQAGVVRVMSTGVPVNFTFR